MAGSLENLREVEKTRSCPWRQRDQRQGAGWGKSEDSCMAGGPCNSEMVGILVDREGLSSTRGSPRGVKLMRWERYVNKDKVTIRAGCSFIWCHP